MTHPGDPPTSPGSGRSIYERLGLTPVPSRPPPRPIPIALPPSGNRKVLRYLIGLPVLLIGLTLLWMNLPIGAGTGSSHFIPSASSEEAQRIDQQDAQIKQLEVRVEALELKMRALQEVNSFQTIANDDHAAPTAPRITSSSHKVGN